MASKFEFVEPIPPEFPACTMSYDCNVKKLPSIIKLFEYGMQQTLMAENKCATPVCDQSIPTKGMN